MVTSTGRSDFLHAAKYGLFVHWTADSRPAGGGPPAPFADAVNAFDVTRFRDQVLDAGAGYVIFTIAHGRQFFPFPSPALDAVLPGRTSRRDLCHDLWDALDPHGVRLLFYYPNIATSDDPEWTLASGYRGTWDADEPFYALQRRLVAEASARYGRKVSGWWVDNNATHWRRPV